MLRFRHWLCGALFLLGILMLNPDPLGGQPPGGFGRGGFGGQPPGGGDRGFGRGGGDRGFGKGGGFGDPERTFGFFARGADAIDFSKMDPNMRAFTKSRFERMGLPAPADNAVITKAQFVETYNRAQAAKGLAPAPGGAPSGPPVVAITPGGNGPPNGFNGGGFGGDRRGFGGGPPNGFGGDRRGFGGGGPPMGFGGGGPPNGFGGFNRGGDGGDRRDSGFRMTDQDIERAFAESDANKDGKLAYDEVSDRSSLKERFKESDTNQDGSIDQAEYKAYIAARFGGGEGSGSGGYGGDARRDDPKRDDQPFAIRYGKLPGGLPGWWTELDTDKDGQVGLYEWRADGRDVAEFKKMDLDADSMLAPQEWARYNVQSAEQARAIAAEEGIEGTRGGSAGSRGTGRGGFPGGGFPPGGGMFPGGGNRGGFPPGGGMFPGSRGSDRDRSDKKDEKNGGTNPFRDGGRKKG